MLSQHTQRQTRQTFYGHTGICEGRQPASSCSSEQLSPEQVALSQTQATLVMTQQGRLLSPSPLSASTSESSAKAQMLQLAGAPPPRGQLRSSLLPPCLTHS